jgi:uncharacterized protein YndB with AHSA1/START domain
MTNEIEKSILLKAPIDRVWRAITNHHEFGAWFRVKLDGPFEIGKPAIGQITYPGYEHIKWKAVVKAMDAPSLFSFTWHPYAIDPNVDYSGEMPTLVEFRLRPEGEGTHLTITESGFENIPTHRMPEAFRMNDGGWAIQIENIRAHVEI